MGFHRPDGACERARIAHPLDADQRRAHAARAGHQIVIGEVGRLHQLHAMAFLVERPHVQKRQIGIAAAAGAQHPGADGQQFDVVEESSRLTRTRS